MSNIARTPPSPFSGNRLKFASHQWLSDHHWTVTATLTMKDHTTEATARDDMKHFWNLLDRKAYGNAAKKKTEAAKKIKRVCLIDVGENNSNVHYHIVALTPADAKWTTDQFTKLIDETWPTLRHAGHHNLVEPIRSVGGCIGYISAKLKYNLDQLDLDCSHF